MQWWEWLVGILLFIVAIGVLIGVHELGHLGAAKLFNVYCINYSIGFGPAIVSSKKSDKHETTWTLRAIPFGGFVAMYGEGVELEDNEYIPPSRSLEGIARPKRAVIITAGVFCNFVLGLLLMFIHNAAFNHVYFYTNILTSNDQIKSALVVSTDDNIKSKGINDLDALALNWDPFIKNSQGAISLAYLDDDCSQGDLKYTLVFTNSIASTKVDPDITTSFALFKQIPVNEYLDKTVKSYDDDTLITVYAFKNNKDIETATTEVKAMAKEEKDVQYRDCLPFYYHEKLHRDIFIDYESQLSINSLFININDVKLDFFKRNDDGKYKEETEKQTITVNLELNDDKNGFKPIGIGCKRFYEEEGVNYIEKNNAKYPVCGAPNMRKYNAGDAFKDSWGEWCNANSTIFVALGRIFSGDVKNVGGIISIAKVSSQTLSSFGFERYLYLWGMISCNLGIINLLPFPGLDGWALAVIIYESISKKQIPMKVKSIVSLVGLVLLFGLMILIVIKDIVSLF